MSLPHPSLSIIDEHEGELRGKCIVLGVTGSAAIYRSIDLARTLMRLGARVRVVTTPAATELVSPTLFEWATGYPVVTKLTGAIEHVTLSRLCDAVVVAPASLDTLAEIAELRASTPVSATVQEAAGLGKPVLLIPAMHLGMWRRSKRLLDELGRQGFYVMEPVIEGEQAKYPPVELAAWWIESILMRGVDLRGKKVLVTAGPTREYIDEVRVLTNPSSGKMGVYLALEARWRGADVVLLHGPLCTALPPQWRSYVEAYNFVSAEDALRLVREHAKGIDLGLYAAAISDYKPSEKLEGKIDSSSNKELVLKLVKTPKVIAEAVAAEPNAVHIGFAAEAASSVEELLVKARRKLEKYRLDAVAANNIREPGAGFGSETNHVYIVDWRGGATEIPRMHKRLVARRILNHAVKLLTEGPRPR
ncbi:bifunctional phosphopantothenoylcysteine decarboxylase/phosphopantothenate--cysteine ligase CoaBC [Pyrofollis japonicus]|uniref:bifunctional phosphopantothenoylcysteine decarboxylase/phosphopantothenate--cysteine ligase CoaBC n=1 Tax=Pyrofollis japonicus TaxID=3060460 RepID=UPI00295B825C|nr:bifunctional phosphopantothenoylcysteine decarboxylase/phosphopantothenate--cysteine ligase CoaBC [Pyrofollis japonicus]BEP18452.1 bifunctional phosphopantothenoylcysteine decarboxylase/phosphopantothenate--cysteine ligase CoaBC [Pyrofollis japonicus]